MTPSITEAEEIVMRALWGQEPSTLGDVAERITGATWSTKTVKTLLDRLCEKNAVGIERWGRRNRYYALVEKESFAKKELGSLAKRLFDGSAHDLIAFFCKNEELTAEQARELIALLEERDT